MLTNLPASVKFACWSPNIIEFSPHYFVERQASPGSTIVGFKFRSDSDSLLRSGLGLVVGIDRGALASQGDKVRPGGQEIKNIPGTLRLGLSALLRLAGSLDWPDGQPGYRRQLDIEIHQEFPEVKILLSKEIQPDLMKPEEVLREPSTFADGNENVSERWIILMIFKTNIKQYWSNLVQINISKSEK